MGHVAGIGEVKTLYQIFGIIMQQETYWEYVSVA
jgi:hypothetical protein